MRNPGLLKKQSGFSLIELIIVITILGIISVMGSNILSSAFQGYLDNKNLIDSDWQARLALERMQRDIRAVRSTADMTTAAASQLVFTNTAGNTLTYALSGTNLTLKVNSNAAQVLANGVQSLGFSYYDRNGASTATLTNIRYITISLNITLNNTNYTVNTNVYTRNLP
jgi:prepilin-type N-terminal cleavage/methylation domain-containing protein